MGTSLRTRNPLPPGTLAVGAGLGVTAAASYLFLVVSARALGKDQFSDLFVLWSLVFLIGGFMLPFEQEVSRQIVGRRVGGAGSRSVVWRAMVVGGAVVAIITIGVAAAGFLITERLFDGQGLLTVALLLGPAGYLVANLTEGVLSGHGRFGRYSVYLGGEATLRLIICLVLLGAGVRTAGPVGLALGLAPILAAIVLLWGRRELIEPGPEMPWSELLTGLLTLLAGSFLAQTLINSPPILVKVLTGPADQAEAGTFGTALLVARIPLFLFGAVQAALLPSLSALAVSEKFTEFRASVRRLALVIVALVVAGTVAAAALGPLIISRVFGDEYQVGHQTMALLAVAGGGYIMASALALATIALGAANHTLVGWLAGVITLFAVAAVGRDPIDRVAVAFASSTLVATAVMALVLRRRLSGGSILRTGPVIEALNDLSFEV